MQGLIPRYVPRNKIDRQRWDNAIQSASSGLVYAQTWWLDVMADTWDAIIYGEYEFVMPLVYRKKWSIKYLYQPAFTQQLGIFGNTLPPQEIVYAFQKILQDRLRFGEIAVHQSTKFDGAARRTNYVLSLAPSSEELIANFGADLKKNYKRATKFQLTYQSHQDFTAAISMYKEQYGKRIHAVTDNDYERFARLCQTAEDNGRLILRKVINSSNEILAIALFIIYENRAYNLMSSVSDAGRGVEANHYLYYSLIQEFAGTGVVLDFEGSDIPGIAHFYRQFGAVDEGYLFFGFNNLPWPLKFFKPAYKR